MISWALVVLSAAAVAGQFGCPTSLTLTSTGGTIGSDTDGAGAATYGNSQSCRWNIQCAGSSMVNITAINMDTESGADYVRVSDAAGNAVFSLSGRYSLPSPLWVGSTAAVVRFTTDGSGVSAGFTLSYRCVPIAPVTPAPVTNGAFGCPALLTLNATNGTFGSDTDGAGPATYPNNQACRWDISCPDRLAVKFTYISMNTESRYDTLQIYDGFGAQAFSRSGAFGGMLLIGTSSVSVRFSSDGSVGGAGFTISYDCVVAPLATAPPPRSVGCPTRAILTASNGTIASDTDGAGPAVYSNSQSCRWDIQCPAGFRVSITSIVMSTESNYDFLRIYDSTGALTFSRSGTYSSTNVMELNPGRAVVQFTSDSSVASSGFSVDYNCTRCSTSVEGPSVFIDVIVTHVVLGAAGTLALILACTTPTKRMEVSA